MSKEKAIEKIQYAKMQVASVYACSAIFDEKTKVIEGSQKELEKAIVNLHDALKELEDWYENLEAISIYVNYKYREVVSTDIKYLGLLEE